MHRYIDAGCMIIALTQDVIYRSVYDTTSKFSMGNFQRIAE